MENLELESSTRISWLNIIIRALLIIGVIIVFGALVKWAQADTAKSIYDGEWTIRYTDCQGNLSVYEEVTVLETGDVWITFRVGNSGPEIKLPVRSNCNEIIMIRIR